MLTFPQMIAGLALASLGVGARQAGVGADALRSVEATTHSVPSVDASPSALERIFDLEDGTGCGSRFLCWLDLCVLCVLPRDSTE